MHVGYIGRGAMGTALAARLLRAHPVCVWDIDGSRATALQRQGATTVRFAADLARCCDVVLMCLPGHSDTERAMFGTGGLAEGLSAGQIVIDQSTCTPGEASDYATQLAQRGIMVVDARIAGDEDGAASGTAMVLASGSDEAYARALPLLSSLGADVVRCGSRVGDAQVMRLLINALASCCALSTLEAVAAGRKMGLSLRVLTDVINRNSGRNRTSRDILQRMADGASREWKMAPLEMLQDLKGIARLGVKCNAVMPLTRVARRLIQIGVNSLRGDPVPADVVALIESISGLRHAHPGEVAGCPEIVASTSGAADRLRIGYVGLGAMGGALARRLMRTRELTVFDIRVEAVHELENAGATPAVDLVSLARTCDVIMICVPNSADVRDVVFGEGGLAEGLSAGKIVVDQTTGDPAMTRRLAADLQKMGVALVDAAVSGAPNTALAGTISMMCGGPTEAVDRVRPILEALSGNISYCGDTGNGHAAKLINHAVAPCNRLLTYELAALGLAYGLSIENMSSAINRSAAWSRASEKILPALATGEQTTTMQLGLMLKDMQLATRMAVDNGVPLLIAGQACDLFEFAAREFGGAETLDAMAKLFERMAGVSFTGFA